MNKYFIPKNDETKELYSIEEGIYSLISRQANLILKYFGKDENDYWTIGLPEALYTILEQHDRISVTQAIEKYNEVNIEKMTENLLSIGYKANAEFLEKYIALLKQTIENYKDLLKCFTKNEKIQIKKAKEVK